MLVETCLTGVLTLSYAFDCQAILVRSHHTKSQQAEFQALAGLVQYLSRIFTVAAIFAMSAATEALPARPNFAAVFAASSLAAIFIFLLALKSQLFHRVLNDAVKPFIVLSFRNIADQSYWRKISMQRIDRLTFASFATNLILLIAAFLPFLIAAALPKYRMTSVYAGQLLNFGATAIVLAAQDPHAMRMLDNGAEEEVRGSLILGRLLSHTVAVAAFSAIVWRY